MTCRTQNVSSSTLILCVVLLMWGGVAACGEEPTVAQEEGSLSDEEVVALSEVVFSNAQAATYDGPRSAPNAFWLGGQYAWFHDEGDRYGFFHTYDNLTVCGPGDAPRRMHVFLPRDYESRARRYPVVYMQDGDTAFWPGGAAGKSWRVAQALSALEGQLEPVIVVAITPLDREREYTHTDWAPGRAWGGADAYTGYVADCVKGFMDAHYHTDPAASRTAIVGSSHGGLLAFYAATRRPDRFGKVGALSPSLWAGVDALATGAFGNEHVRDLDRLDRSALIAPVRARLSSAQRPTLWIDWGLRRDGGFHNSVIERLAAKRGRDMVALLSGRYGYVEGQTLHWHEDAVGGHDEDAWAYRFELMMRALYPAR